jgi:hypothetical protein
MKLLAFANRLLRAGDSVDKSLTIPTGFPPRPERPVIYAHIQPGHNSSGSRSVDPPVKRDIGTPAIILRRALSSFLARPTINCAITIVLAPRTHFHRDMREPRPPG